MSEDPLEVKIRQVWNLFQGLCMTGFEIAKFLKGYFKFKENLINKTGKLKISLDHCIVVCWQPIDKPSLCCQCDASFDMKLFKWEVADSERWRYPFFIFLMWYCRTLLSTFSPQNCQIWLSTMQLRTSVP